MDMQILIVAGLIAVIFIVIRQLDGHYGKIKPQTDVAENYKNFRLNPNLRYYTSGSDIYPQVIMGIDKTWTLESELWRERDLSAQNLADLVLNMQTRAVETGVSLHSFDIFDHRGIKIGNCFSSLMLSMPVKIKDERKVIVFPPSDAGH